MPSSSPTRHVFEVENPPKTAIQCSLSSPANKAGNPSSGSTLVFTHGAGGTFNSDAMVHFSNGFSRQSPIICFNGNMNLKSRVSMFQSIIKDQKSESSNCLGGRSMGARAAVMAASNATSHLVLASYPLHTDKEERDAILVSIPEHIKVIFVVGDRDAMCQLDRLEGVRKRMKCPTWRIVAQGADHGMTMTPRKQIKAVGELIGEVVAQWMHKSSEKHREAHVRWDEQLQQLNWSGWPAKPPTEEITAAPTNARLEPKNKRKGADQPTLPPRQKRIKR